MKIGIFPNLGDPDYFAAEGASNSFLKIGAKSWCKAHWSLSHPIKQTPDMFLGRLTHQAILEPDKPLGVAIKPEGMSFTTKEGKAWRDSNPISIAQKESDAIKGMRDAVWANPDAAALLKLAGHKECAAFAKHEETGLQIKCKFDHLPSDQPLIVDVKTTDCARLFEWQRTCAQYGYHRQAHLYSLIRDILMPSKTDGFFFVVVERDAPYECVVYQMGDRSIEKGRQENERLLWEYKACKESGNWPSYFAGTKQMDLPRWALEDKPEQDETVYQLSS